MHLVYNFPKYWYTFQVTKSKDSICWTFCTHYECFLNRKAILICERDIWTNIEQVFSQYVWSQLIFGHSFYIYMYPFCTNSKLSVSDKCNQGEWRKFVMSGTVCLCVFIPGSPSFAHIQSVKSPGAPWSYFSLFISRTHNFSNFFLRQFVHVVEKTSEAAFIFQEKKSQICLWPHLKIAPWSSCDLHL